MKLKELKEYLNSLSEIELEKTLMVPIFKPGTLGGTPALKVCSISMGFDWDSSAAFVETGANLTLLNRKEVNAIVDSVRKGQSFHAMKRINKLENDLKDISMMILPEKPTPKMLYALWAHRHDMRGHSENEIAEISYERLRQLVVGCSQPESEWSRTSKYNLKGGNDV